MRAHTHTHGHKHSRYTHAVDELISSECGLFICLPRVEIKQEHKNTRHCKSISPSLSLSMCVRVCVHGTRPSVWWSWCSSLLCVNPQIKWHIKMLYIHIQRTPCSAYSLDWLSSFIWLACYSQSVWIRSAVVIFVNKNGLLFLTGSYGGTAIPSGWSNYLRLLAGFQSGRVIAEIAKGFCVKPPLLLSSLCQAYA